MLDIIIIDDEKNSREILRTFVGKYCDEVNIVGEASSVQNGLELLNNTNCDLIFLDIEMAGGTGFDLLDSFDKGKCLICFVTGYELYAIKAIKYGAFDYLLKPLNIQELKTVIAKAKEIILNKSKIQDQMMLNESGKIIVIEYDKIEYLTVNSNYTTIYKKTKKAILSSKNLSHFDSILPKSMFIRIHKSFIVNFREISEVKISRTGRLKLKSGVELSIASRRKKDFIDRLKTYIPNHDTIIKY